MRALAQVEGGGMDYLWDLDRFGLWYYGREPTKSQRKELTRKCRDGVVPAVKVGTQWFVDTMEILEGVEHARKKRSGAACR